ncbi:MAG: hypothetical protein HYX27_17905 [Acidobacteria bacterium]|nr:hypothetical protein [Acidobacteriota bacterium]
MSEYYRTFEAGPDPFGAIWTVEFLWSQNGISIRHADTVDVKFEISSGGIREEKIIALPHKFLLQASHATEQPVTDPWVHRIAAGHLKKMIETGEDIEKTLVTLDYDTILGYAESLRPAQAAGH